jgi:hypothetical protein
VLNASLPISPRPSASVITVPEDDCVEALCDPAGYNHLYQCLNCIIANGGQRTRPPRPSRTVVTISASSVVSSTTSVLEYGDAPWAPINEDNVNGWLANITQYCREKGREVDDLTTTITATPTASYVLTSFGLAMV